jgi:hypothetical protein
METYKSVTTCKIQKKTSEADSFKSIRVITSYAPEYGHIGRNMYCETVATYFYNKAARRRKHNLQNPLAEVKWPERKADHSDTLVRSCTLLHSV